MEYKIVGDNLPAVVISLQPGETIQCESGSMSWMDNCIKMETKTGGIGKMFGRMISGESLALNHYTAAQAGELTLAKHCPGDIMVFNIGQTPIIAQKTSFLAATQGVNMDIYLQQRASAGFFGGEGFLMQKYSGSGYAWLEIDGSVQERELAAGEKLIVDSGYVAAMEASCSMEIQTVKGFTNVILGGEGLFNTVVTGPGKVWLQTMPINALAMNLYAYMPHPSN